MALTPETLPRHELVGLSARVVRSMDPGRVTTTGRVRRETTRTLTLDTADGPRIVPKAECTFAFDVDAPDASTDSDRPTPAGATVVVDGDRLVARPARRTESGARPSWH